MVTSRKVLIFDDEGIGYEGPDGIYYKYDATRGKNLSLTRQQYIFNRSTNTTAHWWWGAGHAQGNGETGWVLPRNGVITSVTAKSLEVNGDDTEAYVWRNDATPLTPENALTIIQYNQSADNSGPAIVSGGLNVNVEQGDFLQIISRQVVGTGVVQYPSMTVEVAWRDD